MHWTIRTSTSDILPIVRPGQISQALTGATSLIPDGIVTISATVGSCGQPYTPGWSTFSAAPSAN